MAVTAGKFIINNISINCVKLSVWLEKFKELEVILVQFHVRKSDTVINLVLRVINMYLHAGHLYVSFDTISNVHCSVCVGACVLCLYTHTHTHTHTYIL